MSKQIDVLVVGGGPAGAAAGIAALKSGLGVTLLETSAKPREKPGETLHPGSAPILEALGVLDAVEAAAHCRPDGLWAAWGGRAIFQQYGADNRGPWRAYQIRRSQLESLLLEEFASCGGRLLRPASPSKPIVHSGRVNGVEANGLALLAAVTIDATGTRGLLRRELGIVQRRISPPLIAHYGYRHGHFGPQPVIEGDRQGWTWIAQVEEDRVAWVRLRRAGAIGSQVPAELSNLAEEGASGFADVTWRMAEKLAGPGWFLVGDAAAVIDPAGSHGVLRALMSGMMAGHSAAERIRKSGGEKAQSEGYTAWLQTWFQHDVARLLEFYASIGFEWHDWLSASDSGNLRKGAVQ